MRGYRFLFTIFILCLSILAGCTWNQGQNRNQTYEQQARKTFILARSGDAVGLDPAVVSDSESFYVTCQVLESLLKYKADGTEVEPALATDWYNSKDGLIWTFELRHGVKFHDGTDFNAQAVKYNFDRWRLWDHPQHQGDFSYYSSMFGGLPGIIKEVAVLDDYQVQFTLAKPHAPFLSSLAMVSFAISSPAAIKKYGDNYYQHPVGTGPFKFKEWITGKQITLTRNDQYWGDRARVGRVVFKVITDNYERLTELQAGKISAALDINPEDTRIVDQDVNLQLLLRPTNNVGYLAINTEKEYLSEVKVRQALNYAIDKKGLINQFYGGFAKEAKNPLPPSLWGYNDDVQGYAYDPAKAKALLAEAGFPYGFNTRLWVMNRARPYMAQPQKIAAYIQKNLLEVGIKAEISSFDWAEYIQKGKNGEHDLYLTGWIGDNGDPDNFLYMLLDKSNAQKGSATNLAFYKNDRVHDLLVKAQEISNQRERADLYERAQALISADAPWVPLVHTTPVIAVNKSVNKWLPHATGIEILNYLEIR